MLDEKGGLADVRKLDLLSRWNRRRERGLRAQQQQGKLLSSEKKTLSDR